MKRSRKQHIRCGVALACALMTAVPSIPVQASEVNNLANKTSNLKNQLDGLNQDLVAISDKISATQKKIDQSDNEVYRLEASLKISYNNEEKPVSYTHLCQSLKKEKLVLPVIRGLKGFSFLMTDETSSQNDKMRSSKIYDFIAHGITCQCIEKHLHLDKQACHVRLFSIRSHLYVP